MKKIFFAAGIFSFLFAAAQQNEIFDLQKQLQKKFEEDQKEKQKEQLLSFQKIPGITISGAHPQARLSQILPNGNKVYYLPQDNMPCVVPNMYQYSMPNSYRQKDYAIKIPNAVIPYKIIPEEKKKLAVPK